MNEIFNLTLSCTIKIENSATNTIHGTAMFKDNKLLIKLIKMANLWYLCLIHFIFINQNSIQYRRDNPCFDHSPLHPRHLCSQRDHRSDIQFLCTHHQTGIAIHSLRKNG